MKNISSDFLFYRAFVGLIIGPFLILLFIRFFFVNNFPDIVVIFIYIALALFVVYQWYKVFKYKKVLFDNSQLIIKSYFTGKSTEIPFSDVIRIEKAFSLVHRVTRMSYKVTFNYQNKVRSIYFYKATALYSVDDLERYIGLEKRD
jgi:hypothetical protein